MKKHKISERTPTNQLNEGRHFLASFIFPARFPELHKTPTNPHCFVGRYKNRDSIHITPLQTHVCDSWPTVEAQMWTQHPHSKSKQRVFTQRKGQGQVVLIVTAITTCRICGSHVGSEKGFPASTCSFAWSTTIYLQSSGGTMGPF